ncbi:MAG TPA: thiol reductant ABC exporter subunit CydC [Leucothrix mucor]|uniref:Thiol reductant ABC exporter subunit CydC n=1 Tax=Leucothrix mucor TaxID=45248 RepID=A0A7V2T0Q4_LEUMU|nr:thiol reductant ABC exporter subunit CydC [Leucothrix mucor]
MSDKNKQSQTNFAVLWRLLLLFKPYWGWMMLGIILSLATIMANVGLMALSGWFIASMAIAGVAGASIDYFSPAAGIRAFAIVRTGSRYVERLVTHEATFRALAELRHWFYLHLEPLAPAVLQQYHSGDLLSRIRADIDALENVYLRIIAPVIVAFISSLFFLYFLSRFDYSLALIELILLLIAGVITPLVVNRLSQKSGKEIVRLSTELRMQVVDGVQGLGELLIYGAAEQQAQKIDTLSQKLLTQQAKMARYNGLSQAILSLCANLALLLIVFITIPLVTSAGLSPANLPMLALFTLASFEAILALPLAFQTLPETLAAAQRVFSIVDTKPLITEPSGNSPKPKHYDIEFNKVSFSYSKETSSVLNKLSFKLTTGSRLGIIGASGIGKSSIINLLLRFWESNKGQIYFGGHAINEYKSDDIRQYFSVVTQQNHFFNSTIKRNLLLAKRDASDAELEQVCRVAQIHEFIQTLEQGYDTWVGEAGLKLSGGQLKRLTIARALLKNAPILILDEPAEGLDSKTEKALLNAIFEYKKDSSILLITHRKVGLDAMDNVLLLSATSLRRDS